MKRSLKYIAVNLPLVVVSIFGILCMLALPGVSAPSSSETYQSMVLKFAPGTATVTPEMREEVAAFVTKARAAHASGAVDEVHVAAFADAIRAENQKLPPDQQELASTRERNLRDYIEKTLKLDVDSSNMAKGPGYLSRTLGTENARIKGEAAVGTDRVAEEIRKHAAQSVAVLVLQIDD